MDRRSTGATLAFAIGMFLAATGAARPDWLESDESIRALVTEKRVFLAIPLGGEFPLYYRSSGRVTGDGSTVGLGRFFAPRETGDWWVADGQLCQKFPTWYKGKTYCFRLQPTGATQLRWRRNDGYSGQARIQN